MAKLPKRQCGALLTADDHRSIREMIDAGKSDGGIAASIGASKPMGSMPVTTQQIAAIRAEWIGG